MRKQWHEKTDEELARYARGEISVRGMSQENVIKQAQAEQAMRLEDKRKEVK